MQRRQLLALPALAPLTQANAGLVDWFNGVKVGKRLPSHDGQWFEQEPAPGFKLQLVDFWATWCAPCVVAIPKLNDWHARFGPLGLAVLGCTMESAELVRAFQKRVPMHYAHWVGGAQPLQKQLGIKALPYALFADADGKVLWKGQPADIDDGLIKRLLG